MSDRPQNLFGFPLSLALSHEGRGESPKRFGNCFKSVQWITGLLPSQHRVSPLPTGEGQGGASKGVSETNTKTQNFHKWWFYKQAENEQR